MKKTVFWLIIVAMAALVVIWVLPARRAKVPTQMDADTSLTEQAEPALEQPRELAVVRSRVWTGLATQAVSTKMLEKTLAHKEEIRQEIEREAALWRSPIRYFGKVVDQNGAPIAGVRVSYSVASLDESLNEVRHTGTAVTDGDGLFKIDNVAGVGLMIGVSHPDYYPYPENPTGFDKRSLPKRGFFADSEERAELFRMHRKGTAVPLVHRRGGIDVPVGGGNATVKFFGTEYNQVIGTLEIEAWGETPKNWSPTPFDWGVRLTVPDGGLVESTDYFGFIAPEFGYQRSVEFNMRKDQANWSDTIEKWFFIKVPRGYIRMRIYIGAKTPMYVSLEYYYNPEGSRNLELDPSRVIRPTQ